MIFASVGSHEPFDRLLRALDQWCAAHPGVEVFGQITDNGSYVPNHFAHTPYLTPPEYRAKCETAKLLIAHAGMGSIITALELAKPIIIMPRRGHLKETRNDHQMATAQQFEGRPGIFVATDESALGSAIDQVLAHQLAQPGRQLSPFAQDRLINFLRAEIVQTRR